MDNLANEIEKILDGNVDKDKIEKVIQRKASIIQRAFEEKHKSPERIISLEFHSILVDFALQGLDVSYISENKKLVKYVDSLCKEFDVKIKKVATMRRKGKQKRTTVRSGGRVIRTQGRTSNWKRAIVTLKEGFSIYKKSKIRGTVKTKTITTTLKPEFEPWFCFDGAYESGKFLAVWRETDRRFETQAEIMSSDISEVLKLVFV